MSEYRNGSKNLVISKSFLTYTNLFTETLPLFIILIGVTAGIILFSIFIASVVVCYRRRRKMQQLSEKPDVTVTTGDMYKESDRSSNISDLKLQLPHSDGTYELVSF